MVKPNEISKAMGDGVKIIVDAIGESIDFIAPELAADIVRNGLLMLGGGAKLKDFDLAVGEYTKHPVVIADEPELCAIHGAWTCPEMNLNTQ